MRTIVFDNEAVQSLATVNGRKHRTVLAHLEAIVARRRRGSVVQAIVPTAVRVEAGWDRSQPSAAPLNRFRIADHPLDGTTANAAAALVAKGVVTSVADAHLGAAVHGADSDETVVLTSDPRDIAAVCSPKSVTIVTI